MGPSIGVVTLLMVVAASASPAPTKEKVPTPLPQKDSHSASSTVVPASTAAPAQGNEGVTHEHHQAAPLHKRSGYLEQLYSEPPGAEMPYFRGGDRRRSNARFVRAPVKRSPMRSFIPRNKRESSSDDDALALLALWASASNRDDLSLLNTLKDLYPQQYYNPEVTQRYENYEVGSPGLAEEPEIVLPGEDEAYPRYSTWSDSDYVVPERFTVMRRSPGGLLPILPSYHKRSPTVEELPSGARWGPFASQRKRFVVAKRTPASQGDVYSLAQMLGEEQQSEPNVPVYRRFML